MYANDDVCNKHSQQLRTEEEASAIHARRPTASPTTTALLPCEEMLLFSFFQLCCPVPFFSLSHRSPATLHRRSSIMTTAVYVLLWCIMMPSLLLVVRPVAAEVSLTCFPSATAYVITPSSIGTDRVVSLRSCPFPIIVNFTEGAASNTMIVISGSALPIMYFYDTLINTSITIASSYSYSTSDAATVAQLDAVPCYLCVVALQVDFLSITVADTTIVLNQTTASATTTGAQRSFILFGMVQTATSSGLIPYPTKSVALTMSHSTVQIFSTNTAPDYLSVGTIGALVILSTNVAGPMNIVIASASNITSSGNWTLNPLVYAATTVSQATVVNSSGSQLNMTTPAMFLFNGVVTSVNVTFDSSAVVWIAPNSNAISNPAMIVVLGNTTARDINRDVNLLISRSTITARKAVSSLSPAFSACVGPAQGWSWMLVDSVVSGLDRGIILLSQTSQFSLACYGSVMGISLLVLSAQTLDNASLLFASGTTTPSPSSTFTPSSWVNANRLSNARAVVTDSGTSIIVMLAIQANYMYNASVYIQSGATLSTPALISFTSVCVLCVSTVMENASLDVSGVGTTLFANAIYLYFGFPLAIPAGFISTLFGSLANVTLSVRLFFFQRVRVVCEHRHGKRVG
ncbi:transmembrane protein, putative [Bodo saltans]|uniref:Transmembrane protein, putative n=1 Tax=Bodo saltans TaxID=75058 RepID=A0A0S4IRH1_BODSA|nr:transmembrane protein, putative [Bodo saltans]|eukprot:CUF42524.1 transmembrane protein, putative [Bodo saltans]